MKKYEVCAASIDVKDMTVTLPDNAIPLTVDFIRSAGDLIYLRPIPYKDPWRE